MDHALDIANIGIEIQLLNLNYPTSLEKKNLVFGRLAVEGIKQKDKT